MADDLGRTVTTKIGTTIGNVTDTKVEPHVEFMVGAATERNICAQDKYVGNPRCRWTYPDRLLSGEQFFQLKNIVGNSASASVVIDIPTQTLNQETYAPLGATYNAVMHWPQEGVTRVSHNRWQFPDEGILFTNLEPV